MRPPDDRTPGCLRDLREGDGQPEIPQPLHEQLVSARSVQAEFLELGLQWALARLYEIGEGMHRPGLEGTRDLAAWHERDTEAGGAGSSLEDAGETVMVRQRHRRTTSF